LTDSPTHMRGNFDDLLFRAVNLFELYEDVRMSYAQAFKHVLVDEYQDTNHAQYRLLQLLVGGGRSKPERTLKGTGGSRVNIPGQRNLAVVGASSTRSETNRARCPSGTQSCKQGAINNTWPGSYARNVFPAATGARCATTSTNSTSTSRSCTTLDMRPSTVADDHIVLNPPDSTDPISDPRS
jgi:hypothetical protein